MTKGCVFCDQNELREKSTIEVVEDFKFILDPFPSSHGHVLIVPNTHVESIDELNPEKAEKLQEKIVKAKEYSNNKQLVKERYFEALKAEGFEKSEQMIKAVIGEERNPEGFNIGINEGVAAGQTIDHMHIHVIPRYEGDVENPEGGIRNVMPERADYT
jgi:diadenosine tetraphosphate (Ap4A) HIT family hydrolase